MADCKPQKDNTFCWYPFYHLAFKVWIDGDLISYAPCCNSIRPESFDPLNAKDTMGKQSIHDLFHSPEMQQLRSDLLSGIKNPTCQTCWRREENSTHSYRQGSSPPGSSKLDIDINNPQLLSVDISFGENCNLRCRMCTPGNSNKLRIDNDFFYKNNLQQDINYFSGWEENTHQPKEVVNFDTQNSQFQSLLKNIHDIRIIKATGGETLLTEGFIQLLDEAIKQNVSHKITLNYHTNATVFTDEMMVKLKHFENNPNFSIDAVGKTYEYIRYPMKWSTLEKSVDNYINQMPDTWVHFSAVVSIFNLFNLTELLDWVIYKTESSHIKSKLYFDTIWPFERPTDICWLPKQILQQALVDFTKTKQRLKNSSFEHNLDEIMLRIETIINNREENDEKIQKMQLAMLKEVKIFDLARNQSYKDYLDPIITDFFEKLEPQLPQHYTNPKHY